MTKAEDKKIDLLDYLVIPLSGRKVSNWGSQNL